MKKPAHLKLKENNKIKRSKGAGENASFETRKQRYAELKELRQRLKDKNTKIAKKERKRLVEKKKRKEINDLRSGAFQVIKNPEKIKKWKLKARKMLQRIPPEIFYEQVSQK